MREVVQNRFIHDLYKEVGPVGKVRLAGDGKSIIVSFHFSLLPPPPFTR